ncbi:DNA-directed RNA polymerase III subunit RPC10 isoform X1 [Eucalyptus grandis]|uniref:DNA-directed RNA polymerase III subunit RPC10 isoform X1 n=1 Tax=Eucalyptus grandis TaxID=71139 RepID=UPI00192E7FEC|nr:DNA-directed RNA polymerase III subunit RPC10 isoform X1 [Eucalyptus grandis]XP_039170054.1 DNA-directed RNA polymerase III subunit RPC10 isoform X1 [Eucalyptus grandis]
MEFCPTCGNLLQYELPHRERPARFFCPTCPYVCNIETKVKIKRKQHLVRKKMDPVFSEEDRRNGPQTDGVTCPHCGHGKAIYHQALIRSADEPMTTFYWCLNEKCKKNWRED